MKYLLLVVFCFFSTQLVYGESKNKRNICEDVGLTNPLLGLCNAYLNVDCRGDLKHGSPQCIALRKNFLARSGGKNIDDILNITPQVSGTQRVFDAKVMPDEFFTNKPSTATISAEIASGNLYLSSVVAYETDENGNLLTELGRMYDDGTHGDARAADTIFTLQIDANKTEDTIMYVRVLATYAQDANRYLSSIMKIDFLEEIPDEVFFNSSKTLKAIHALYLNRLAKMPPKAARELAYREAQRNPDIQEVRLNGVYLSILFKGGSRGFRGSVRLDKPDTPIDGAGNSVPSVLPEKYKALGNDKLLIFAPGYNDTERQNKIADDAKARFDRSEYTFFDPKPSEITTGENASLELIKQWGDYGVVILHAHGAVWEKKDGSLEVTIASGTRFTAESLKTYKLDIQEQRIDANKDDMLSIYPSFISKYASPMKNTFFYLGACQSLANDTLWDALRAKGAKVAFGWSDSVERSFNDAKFKEVIEAMLPINSSTDLLTAKEAYNSISDKVNGWCLLANVCISGKGAALTLKTATPEWDDFILYEGGIVNGDFETGDWTGWTHGGDYNYRLISSAKQHQDKHSAALGRWDTVFHGADSAAEPYGYEWFYQDFVVPDKVTYLKFYWWMETYDTAVWDWFDAYIKDTNGNTLKTILNHAGKPGSFYGPYWTTSGWQEVSVDVSAYRGQKIRIHFDQRLDGYGDQQRVYIDDVTLK